MAKFVMECPNCGNFVEGRTGFFARKKIDCSCGYTINIRTEKLTSRICSHCGNTVVFDQSKGDRARCPVCHEPINTLADQSHMAEIPCAQCGVRLMVPKTAQTYTCPVCDCVNNVAERLAGEKIRQEGEASRISYEGDAETLVWKHPVEDFNRGSVLIVHESQEAVFFRDGRASEPLRAGRYVLEPKGLPVLGKLLEPAPEEAERIRSEVWFVNKATQMAIKWGTDTQVRFFDPASGLHVEIGASGEFNIRVSDSRQLLMRVVGTTGGLNQEMLMGSGTSKGYFRTMVMTHVKSYLAQTIKDCGISILEIDAHLLELSEALKERLNRQMAGYGLEITEFFVSRVKTPDEDPNFRRMKQQYADRYLKITEENIRRQEAEAAAQRRAVEARADADRKVIEAGGDAEAMRIKAAAEAEALRLRKQAEADGYLSQATAEAREMQMKGITYRDETTRQVSLEALKNGVKPPTEVVIAAGPGLAVVGSRGKSATDAAVMKTVNGMVTDAVDTSTPAAAPSVPEEKPAAADSWDCPNCGKKGITSKFCPDCGSSRPAPPETWDCPACGAKGLTSRFCPECGAPRPEKPAAWTCPQCGKTDITSKFCPECGMKKPEQGGGPQFPVFG